jgi:hypothetical protein
VAQSLGGAQPFRERVIPGRHACVQEQIHADFLRGGFVGFFCSGLRASEIHAGGSLAGKDSSEASSTGSKSFGTSAESCISNSSDFDERNLCLSAGLAIVPRFYIRSLARGDTVKYLAGESWLNGMAVRFRNQIV